MYIYDIMEDMETKFIRNCPKCNKEILYSNKFVLRRADEKHTLCNKGRCNGVIPDGGWTKLCPLCKGEQKYLKKWDLMESIKNNTLCRKCCLKGKTHSIETKQKISESNKGKIVSDETRRKLSENNCKFWLGKFDKNHSSFGKKRTEEEKQKMSEYGKLNPIKYWKGKCRPEDTKLKISNTQTGRKMSDEFKENQRKRRLKEIDELGIKIPYNPNACKFIEEFGKKNGYNFQHALNGGEVRISWYSVDGYDKDKNVIFEYDESNHESPSLKYRDLERTKRLISKCGCKIIRFSEKYNKIYYSYPEYSEILGNI